LLGKISSSKQQKIGMVNSKPDQKGLAYIKSLIESGKVKPLIDKRYKLEEAAQAMAYLEEEHARGKIVLTVIEGKGVRKNQ
jgi:NADPH:quinone reductase-like Zn-dependent oxidoreductase